MSSVDGIVEVYLYAECKGCRVLPDSSHSLMPIPRLRPSGSEGGCSIVFEDLGYGVSLFEVMAEGG